MRIENSPSQEASEEEFLKKTLSVISRLKNSPELDVSRLGWQLVKFVVEIKDYRIKSLNQYSPEKTITTPET